MQDGDPRLEPFPATQWTVVDLAAESGLHRTAALTELVRRYREPLRSHLIRVRCLEPDQADDFLQGFLTSQVIERGLIRRADRSKGRFRTFILMALNRYVSNQLRQAKAQKRGHGRVSSFNEEMGVAGHEPPPAHMFDVVWARQVLNDAIQRMISDCSLVSRPDLWGVFHARVLRPAFEGIEPLPYGELVRQFDLRSPSQASNTLITAKRMFQRSLRAVIAEYEPDQSAIDRELMELRQILSRPTSGTTARALAQETPPKR